MKDPDGWLARWAIKLQLYDFKKIHWPGSAHLNADGLSRLPFCALGHEVFDLLYNYIIYKSLWNHFPLSQQKLLEKIAQNTKVTDNLLYKFVKNK